MILIYPLLQLFQFIHLVSFRTQDRSMAGKSLRKEYNWSQSDLAEKVGVSRVIIGRYERNEALPSIEVAKKIADAFQICMDQLIGEGQNASFDKKTFKRLEELELLEPDKKKTLFDLIDTYIRDAKTRQAYAS